MNIKGELLKPDLSKATSKITITVTGYKFGEGKNLYCETKWIREGEFTIGDFMNALESAKQQTMLEFNKTDQN